MPLFTTLLALCYPLVAHISIYAGHVEIAAYFLGFMLLLPLLGGLIQRGAASFGRILLALAGMLVLLIASYQPQQLVQAYPVLVYGAMFFLFAASLLKGSTPLVSRFAILIRGGSAPPVVVNYGRRATQAWVCFFLAMILISLYLGNTASLQAWSWFANFFSYLLVGAMFVVEFAIRRCVLKGHVDYSFRQFIRSMMDMDVRRLTRGWRA
jgi:uncharacterized membrane protein